MTDEAYDERSVHLIEGGALMNSRPAIPWKSYSARVQYNRTARVRPDAPEWWALGVDPPPERRSAFDEHLQAIIDRHLSDLARLVFSDLTPLPPRPWRRRLQDRVALWRYRVNHAFCCSCGEDY